jgi:hypothetical protein
MVLSARSAIDLRFSSGNVISLAGLGSGQNPPIDIMFSPRGNVSGVLQGLGAMHFLLRDLKDATAAGTNFTYTDSGGNAIPCGGWIVGPDPRPAGTNQWGTRDPNQYDRLIVTVFPQTGLVQVYEIDPTDVIINGSNPVQSGSDGIADDIFHFARIGSAAGR